MTESPTEATETKVESSSAREDTMMPVPGGMEPQGNTKEHRMIRRTRIYFAMISCLGGLVMGIGDQATQLPIMSTFAAVFGYLCVDRFKLFALPPILAYTIMAIAGLYCVGTFTSEGAGSKQILAVAELLMVVQAVMMLQKKSLRVYEQIIIFALLQLVVAAVFNDAIMYGLILVPIGIVAAWAQCFLASLSAASVRDDASNLDTLLDPPAGIRQSAGSPTTPREATFESDEPILTYAPDSESSFLYASKAVAWVAFLSIVPATTVLTGMFFYALPRTTNATRTNQGGNALVGFSESVSLDKVGNLLQDSTQVMRVTLSDRTHSDPTVTRPYLVSDPIYLKGKTLENYSYRDTRNAQASWSTETAPPLTKPIRSLPKEDDLLNEFVGTGADAVSVTIQCESLQVPALFSIAPYFETTSRVGILHEPARWTIRRRSQSSAEFLQDFPRLEYQFGTLGFEGGLQRELVPFWSSNTTFQPGVTSTANPGSQSTTSSASLDPSSGDSLELNYRRAKEEYVNACLAYTPSRIPRAKTLSNEILQTLPYDRRGSYEFAQQATSYLNSGVGGFEYTLDLGSERIPGKDPIEQFLALDKKGHCQFYASALVMMLRSQGIPARMVVGYCSDEYNTIGDHYVVRQLHAHAWVEALIMRDQLPGNRSSNLAVSENAPESYWLRLDPTPGGGGGGQAGTEDRSGVNQMFDIAQNIWKDYVVDMDGERQEQALLASATDRGMSDTYGDWIRRIQSTLSNVRAGELGGGALAGDTRFSWPAALAAIGATITMAILLRLKLPTWLKSFQERRVSAVVDRPSLDFYATTLDRMAAVGVHRESSQTPIELQSTLDDEPFQMKMSDTAGPIQSLFSRLTTLFYQTRYGSRALDSNEATQLLTDLEKKLPQ